MAVITECSFGFGALFPIEAMQGMMGEAVRVGGSSRFGFFMFGDGPKQCDTTIATPGKPPATMKSGPGKYQVGVNLAMHDEQTVDPYSDHDHKRAEVYTPWLAAAASSDYVGARHTRAVESSGQGSRPSTGVELTRIALRILVRSSRTDHPLRRHRSYRPKFGLVAMNRETQQRSPKPSAGIHPPHGVRSRAVIAAPRWRLVRLLSAPRAHSRSIGGKFDER